MAGEARFAARTGGNPDRRADRPAGTEAAREDAGHEDRHHRRRAHRLDPRPASGRLWGHEVAISNSREPETLAGLVDEIGSTISAVTAEEAADHGPLVIVSIPYGRYRELPAERLRGKVVVDTCKLLPGPGRPRHRTGRGNDDVQ